MRKVVINGLLGGFVAFVLARHGITLSSPAWWLVFGCICAMIVNSWVD